MKKRILLTPLILAFILLPVFTVWAADIRSGDSIYVAKDQIVSGNLYASGQTITIDGTVSGDLIVAGQTLNINGQVDGDIIAATQNLNFNGSVGGNIRVVGNALNLNGNINRNLNAFGASVILGEKAKIGWDALIFSASTEVRGEVGGELSGATGQALITGKIGKSVDLKMNEKNVNQKLIVGSGATIGGDLKYSAKAPAQIDPKATIGGQTKQSAPAEASPDIIVIWLWKKIISIFSAIVVGLLLVFILPKVTSRILKELETEQKKMLWRGLIIMLIVPPLALLLAFTIIGLPLAVIAMAWWLIAMYVARIFTALLLGRLVFQKIFKQEKPSLLWSLVVGVAVLWLLVAIPFVGWVICLLAIWLGLGGVFSFMSKQIKNFSE